MPPTTPSPSGHTIKSLPLKLPGSGSDVNRVDNLRGRELGSILAARNDTSEQGDGQPITTDATGSDTTVSDTTLSAFTPYEPPTSLHPSIIPTSVVPEPSGPPELAARSRPHINTAAIVISFSVLFTSVLCGLFLIMLVAWLKRRNFFRWRYWFRRGGKRETSTPAPEEDPVVFVGVEYTGGTALVHDTTMILDLGRKSSSDTMVDDPSGGPPLVPPSINSAESLTIQPDYSTPTMTGFQQRLDTEEADITMAIGIAMRDCTYSGSELSTISQGPYVTAIHDCRDGCNAENRTRQGSDASDSTEPTTESDGFSIAPTTRSSLTSIVEVPHDSDFEEVGTEEVMEMEMEVEEDMIFEVARAQAQSMEIKRGVLFNWCSQRASLSPVLEEASPSLKSPVFPSSSFATVPSLVVTCPSMMTIPHIRPSFSSVSVDLNEFPLPPTAFHYDKPFDEYGTCRSRSSPWAHDFIFLLLPYLPLRLFLDLRDVMAFVSVLGTGFNPLQRIAGPPCKSFSGNMSRILDPAYSHKAHEIYVKRYGRSIRIRGLGPWDERLLTLDPLSVQHVLKHTSIYEKPWQSRALITSLIGCGMLSAEGQVHKRQRRVATPAFSIQNLRELVPLVFKKGNQLKDKWMHLADEGNSACEGPKAIVDVCRELSRATFDVIGIAGFDYNFNSIQDESNELFLAYRDMFETALAQCNPVSTLLVIYFPWLTKVIPDERQKIVERCRNTISRVAGQLIQEKKRKIEEAARCGKTYDGKDLLSLLLKSNASSDIDPESRISDDDVLHTINTFMFAGSDTTSLTLTWTLHLLAQKPDIQTRLRNELLSIAPSTPISNLTEEEIQSLYSNISNLPFLHNVTQEALRLFPPLHSSLRVATQDDEIPTMYPVHDRDGNMIEGKRSVTISKGSFVHIAVEGFNMDKEMWGEDAWDFNPDRWDALPEKAQELPGLFSHTLSFSSGPRSCIGMRFSMIEIKTFLYILFTHFEFTPTEDKIHRVNVVLNRPFISKRFKEGSQLPMIVKPFVPEACST
ncbi:hypothetical protein NP233_g3541 [Leucocoprinus birnbaumii]|uniref:Cytochrome P450 n=1 Tax=Leucocoprinus birnbaumii TaxID=56174 RepID=A0AAD5YY92_9AGAR|nr:hypothetical protein NP233_g3541 [Leucocoprinus birnbaumii]